MDAKYEILYQKYILEGRRAYSIHVFGDHIAKREGYETFDGMEAIQFYIMNKYKWLPSVVRAMSMDDIEFVLQEEMDGWVLPGVARY